MAFEYISLIHNLAARESIRKGEWAPGLEKVESSWS
jgi:hypothetical protein